jgi:lysophospholipase L1-like esterase
MRIRMLTLSILAILWPVAFAHASGQTYYLALGDSLSVGAQPNLPADTALVPTPQGYSNDIFNKLSQQNASLQLKELGCIGETTTSMIQGGVCDIYGADGSQLKAAIDFLEHNQVSLITLDIGANDIDPCISMNGINDSCVFSGLVRVGGDLSFILGELRRAAGPNVPIIGMNYYDPFLAAWTLGPSGQVIAIRSLEATDLFNGVLDSVYHVFGVPVADVAGAFQINNFAPGPLNLPENVDRTFALTWVSLGLSVANAVENVHPNPNGYEVIAAAFEAKIGLPAWYR